MAESLPGRDTSLWIDTTPDTNYPSLSKQGGLFDVIVVGGGISGLLTALFLQEEGLKTVLVEKSKIIQNTTGNTTAKLTSQHNLIYDFLIKKHGQEVAQAYANANQQAIEELEKLGRRLGIAADFSRTDAYVYSEKVQKLTALKREVKAAQGLGLPASFHSTSELPFAIAGAIKFARQAQFHPRKYLLPIAKHIVDKGGKIYENTEAKDIKPGKVHTLKTTKGDIKAKYIVVASKYPFWQAEIFNKASWVKLSYALGVILSDDNYPKGMYITPDNPVRTIRSHPYKKAKILIFGGESHKMTSSYDKAEHYRALADDVRQKFSVSKIIYRWIAGDMMPYDRLPYIGAYPGSTGIYVITGFHAWGLTWAIMAAQLVTNEILSRPHFLHDIVGLRRLSS